MGLDVNGVQSLMLARNLGADFSRTLMIGRQAMNLSTAELTKCLETFGYSSSEDAIRGVLVQKDGSGPYAEEFLRRFCGAEAVDSLDNSEYEGATVIHDLNYEIANDFKQQYSVVLDGGSLEHVFNFPVAIKSCMEMVSVGGHYIGITPTNNFMGHGFYQFSPELWFNVFSESNGFEIAIVIAYEDDPEAEWYVVENPAAIRSRVTLINDNPVYLLIVAKRIANSRPFLTMPFQSDYVTGLPWSWSNTNNAEDKSPKKPGISAAPSNRLREVASKYAPNRLKRLLRFLLRRNRGFDPRYFHSFSRTAGPSMPSEAADRRL
jgi:hypothetical protein